jgi:magnesium-transporting ATPase (P-type)
LAQTQPKDESWIRESESEATPLQMKLEKLASYIGKMGLLAAIFVVFLGIYDLI